MYFVMYVIWTIWQHLSFLYQLVGRGRICQAKKNHLFPVPRRRDFWKIWKLFFIFLKIMHFLDNLGPRKFFSSRDEKNFACGALFKKVMMTNIGFWYLIVSIVSRSCTFKGTDKMWRNHHTSLVVYSPFGSIWYNNKKVWRRRPFGGPWDWKQTIFGGLRWTLRWRFIVFFESSWLENDVDVSVMSTKKRHCLTPI